MAADENILLKRLLDAIDGEIPSEIRSLSSQFRPADLAAFVNSIDEDERQRVLSPLDKETVGSILEFLPGPDAAAALTELTDYEKRLVLDNLPDDELVDFLQEVPSETKKDYIDLLSDTKKAVSSDLLKFPERTAGGRMTTALATLREDMTVTEAIDSLTAIKESMEILSRIFVVDDANHLLGFVRLRDLTFNPRSTLIRDVMERDPIAVTTFADQEEAAQTIAKYDLLALPVVDEGFKLVGVVTHDDAFEILEEESTEDLEKFSAIAGNPGDANYLQTSVPMHFRRRIFWILPLALLAILSGIVIYRYEQVLDQVYLLVVFLPMVVAAGGNTGSQSATTVIRAMSLGEFTPSAIVRVVWKEFRIGLLLGGILGICVALVIQFLMPRFVAMPAGIPVYIIAVVVGLALTAQVTSSTLLGALLPIGARALKLDPAVVASPAITTLVDVTGLVIYLALAKALMGL